MRALIPLCLALLVGCVVPTTRDPMELPEDHLNKYVLVWQNAWFYVDRSDSAQHANEAPTAERDLGVARAFRLRGVRGNWVEVENLSGNVAERHCVDATPGLANYRIRLYVHKGDLAPVTTHEVFTEYEDGTSIGLAAGVPVSAPRKEAMGRAMYAVQTDRFRLATGLPMNAVGLAYEPSNHFSPMRTGQLLRPEVPLSFGGGGRLEPLRAGDSHSVYETRPAGQAMLATLRSRCGQYVVSVAPSDVRGDDPPLGVAGAVLESSRGELYVRTNAIVYWPNGAAAGYAIKEEPLGKEAEPSGARRCFLRPLGPASKDTSADTVLHMCFDAADIWAPSGTAPGAPLPPPPPPPSASTKI